MNRRSMILKNVDKRNNYRKDKKQLNMRLILGIICGVVLTYGAVCLNDLLGDIRDMKLKEIENRIEIERLHDRLDATVEALGIIIKHLEDEEDKNYRNGI